MLIGLGRKLLGGAVLPAPLAAAVAVAEVALVAAAVVRELDGEDEEDEPW
ncbi:hypothetical protein GMSM_42670 [Geomonas sp. Red276]